MQGEAVLAQFIGKAFQRDQIPFSEAQKVIPIYRKIGDRARRRYRGGWRLNL